MEERGLEPNRPCFGIFRTAFGLSGSFYFSAIVLIKWKKSSFIRPVPDVIGTNFSIEMYVNSCLYAIWYILIIPKKQIIVPYRRKSMNGFMFMYPTQLSVQGQWWSILYTQR